VIQDADLEYDPLEIPGLLGPILRNEAEIVYGSRFIGETRQTKTWIHQFGNGMLTGMSNFFSGLKLTDMETCYKAFRRDVLDCLEVNQNRFGIEPELTAKLARRGYRFVEVPTTRVRTPKAKRSECATCSRLFTASDATASPISDCGLGDRTAIKSSGSSQVAVRCRTVPDYNRITEPDARFRVRFQERVV
jgi:hypothetical protein